jgi:hypothetical protein
MTDALIIINLMLGASVLVLLNGLLLVRIRRERVELGHLQDIPVRDVHPIEELLYGPQEG